MCLVSYIPLQGADFVITSNRDESPSRATTKLNHEIIGKHAVTYPRDIKGGSWLFASHRTEVLCLLNGAFTNHKHQPPYRLSRGVMMKEYFTYDSPVDFLKRYDFDGIEPFTMIIRSVEKFLEVRWDEQLLHIEILDPRKPYVWSSSTLYHPDAIKVRQNYFFDELMQIDPTPASIFHLHKTGMSENKKNGFVMNREDRVATLSVSRVIVQDGGVKLIHEDLQSGTVQQVTLTS